MEKERVRTQRIGIISAMKALFGQDDVKDELSKEEIAEIARLNDETKNVSKLEEEVSNSSSNKKKNGGFGTGYKVEVQPEMVAENVEKVKTDRENEDIQR